MHRQREVLCGCGRVAELVNGTRIYPHRTDLDYLRFFLCVACNAWVGCHRDGRPLGTLADAATREARQRAHAAFDPLWKSSDDRRARSRAYRWLAGKLRIRVEECHIGHFDAATCYVVAELAREERQRSQRARGESALAPRAGFGADAPSGAAAPSRRESP